MLPISSTARFFLYSDPVDMRKSFDGLQGLINNALNMNPLSGDVYLFVNRRRDRMKILVWDRNGFWILYKRLERGRFQELFQTNGKTVEFSYDYLILLLEGIDITSVKRRKRFNASA